jgi:solute carrier family 10 (sodium/bile acid cotransporter), member 7
MQSQERERVQVHMFDQTKQTDAQNEEMWHHKAWEWAKTFTRENDFLILILVSIALAHAYPPLGATYLQPHITATWIAVIIIFVLSGLGLKTNELASAFTRVYFNAFVLIFNFFVVSFLVFTFSRLLVTIGALPQALADGMVASSCVPIAINLVIVMTTNAGGDTAAAIFNAAFGNVVGVFVSPILILAYLGKNGSTSMTDVFFNLTLRVVLPLGVGQLLQKIKAVADFRAKNKEYFQKAPVYALCFIVYTVFCKTFQEKAQSRLGDVFLMILFQFLILIVLMVLAWYSLKLCFPENPKLRVMGLFGCTNKSMSVGVPLIIAIYELDPNVSLYTLPLLIWHPMTLVLGSALTPRLAAFVKRENERLGIVNEDGTETEVTPHETSAQDEEGGETAPLTKVRKGYGTEQTPGSGSGVPLCVK